MIATRARIDDDEEPLSREGSRAPGVADDLARIHCLDPGNTETLIDLTATLVRIGHGARAIELIGVARRRGIRRPALDAALIAGLLAVGRLEDLARLLGASTIPATVDPVRFAEILLAAGWRKAAVRWLQGQFGGDHPRSDDAVRAARQALVWLLVGDGAFADCLPYLDGYGGRPSLDDPLRALGRGDASGADRRFQALADAASLPAASAMRMSAEVHDAIAAIDLGTLPAIRYVGDDGNGDGRAGESWAERSVTTPRRRLFLVIDAQDVDRISVDAVAGAVLGDRCGVHLHVIEDADRPVDTRRLEDLARLEGTVITSETFPAGQSGSPIPTSTGKADRVRVGRFARAWRFLTDGAAETLVIIEGPDQLDRHVAAKADTVTMAPIIAAETELAAPWERFHGDWTIVHSDPDGIAFLGHVARYLIHLLDAGPLPGGAESCALFCTRAHFDRDRSIADVLSRVAPDPPCAGPLAADPPSTTTAAPMDADLVDTLSRAVAFVSRVEGQGDLSARLRAALLAAAPNANDTRAAELRRQWETTSIERFAALCPPLGSPFLADPDRRDLDRTKRLLDLFLELNATHATEVHSPVPGPLDASADTSSPAIERALVASILSSTRVGEPFTHASVHDIFPADVHDDLAAVLADAPTQWGGNPSYPDRGNVDIENLRRDRAWAAVCDALMRQSTTEAMLAALGAAWVWPRLSRAGFRVEPSFRVSQDRRRYSLGPHKDHPSRLATALIYVTEETAGEAMGTSVYRHRRPRWRLDNGRHQPFDRFEEVRRLPYRPNTGLIFLNLGHAYHGVEEVVLDTPRTMIQHSLRLVPLD